MEYSKGEQKKPFNFSICFSSLHSTKIMEKKIQNLTVWIVPLVHMCLRQKLFNLPAFTRKNKSNPNLCNWGHSLKNWTVKLTVKSKRQQNLSSPLDSKFSVLWVKGHYFHIKRASIYCSVTSSPLWDLPDDCCTSLLASMHTNQLDSLQLCVSNQQQGNERSTSVPRCAVKTLHWTGQPSF